MAAWSVMAVFLMNSEHPSQAITEWSSVMFCATLRPTDQPARKRAGGRIMIDGLFAGHESCDITLCALHHAPRTGGKIEYHFRQQQLQAILIDHVDVGAITRGNAAAIIRGCRVRPCRG